MKLIINSEQFRFFNNFSLTLTANAIASRFTFTALQQDIIDYMFNFPSVQVVTDEDEILLTGTILSPNLQISTVPELIEVNGYSSPGVLEDCPIPYEAYPIQYDNLSLKQIADKLLPYFDLKYEFTDNISTDFNKPYKKVTSEIGMPVRQFLQDLASQRNICLSHNVEGKLLFTRFFAGTPVAQYIEGQWGQTRAKIAVDSQRMHSEITVVKQGEVKNLNGVYKRPILSKFTIQNPYITDYRPTVALMNTGDNNDVEKAARNLLSEELSNITFVIETTKFTMPGEIIEFQSPSLGVNNLIQLFVQEVSFTGTTKTEDKVVLTCVLPDVYDSGEVVRRF